jgi:hypothetical protein
MGASRTSNKDILDAILGLTEAIKAQNVASPVAAPAPAVAAEAPQGDNGTEINVSKEYLENRKQAAQAHANKVNGTIVLYARRNLQQETKLAFAQQGRYDTLRDKGLIGPVAVFQPE